jgi:hypothetical protein
MSGAHEVCRGSAWVDVRRGRSIARTGVARGAPLLAVLNPYSRVIPPESILPFHHAAGGRPKQLIRYRGDRGVALQHVGVLVGRNAHRFLWPLVLTG